MTDILWFLAAPFAACVVLVLMLGYLGLHVLLREVIFVDLALAQIAAFGVVVAFYFGYPPESVHSFAFALGAATVGAAIFSWTRMRDERVPQEALIGITFVIASAASILVADRAPEGAEHIKELLAGTVLWVSWERVLGNLAICALVAVLHLLFRRRFVQISEAPEEAFAAGVRVRWWDFLFYLSFGLVITVAVETAGVLMVFAYLVGPAIIALSTSRSWIARLLVAWSAGIAASLLGLAASYRWDLPSGPAIVVSLGLLLFAFGLWRVAWSKTSAD
ncbi:MAG: iron chelate uptake ABC transporter family permease subunit [Thermoanaerobaculia bacterium]|nr:iron chelate uptake ABC transporter family permease subunit [Thermoanaerobaculia bacterium]